MTWTIDAAHSAVTFSAKHMMVTTVRGSMGIRDFELDFRPDDLAASSVRVAMDVASIDTGQEGRDQHLRSADFLDADAHPTIDFVSTRIEPRGDEYTIHGDLTIRGVTRPIVLAAEYVGTIPNLQGGQRAAFSASARIDRDDFDLTWNVALEQGGWLVSKEIKVQIDLAVTSSQEAAADRAETQATPEAVTA